MTLTIPSVLTFVMLVAGVESEGWQGNPPTVKQLFEAGKYQEAVNRLNTDQGEAPLEPQDQYIVSQAYLKLGNGEAAKRTLERLLQRGDTDPWALAAKSERARIDQNLDEALASAQAAVAQSPPMPAAAYALFQLGLVQSQRRDLAAAADSFEKATTLDPAFAYAHYYAGMAYSNLQRIDRVASHFEAFLKLAPQAPERGAVESVMRTVRGSH